MTEDPIQRATVLLKATRDLIQECDDSRIVICPTETTVFYDGADCDGLCLKDDIEAWLMMHGGEA